MDGFRHEHLAVPTDRPNIILASKRPPFPPPRAGKPDEERSPGGLVQVVEPSLVTGDRWVAVTVDGILPSREARSGPRGIVLRHAKIDGRCAKLFDAACNEILWFALHGLRVPTLSTTELTLRWEEGFRRANSKVSEVLAEEWERQPAPILIQDFQLFLTPAELRDRVPKAQIAFFCHTPFPELDHLRKLPLIYGLDILRGLLSCDLIGFQTNRDLAAFSRACAGQLGLTVRHDEIVWQGHRVRLGVFPASIDSSQLSAEAYEEETAIPDDHQVITWVGRSDPAKNPVGAIRAFRRLLEQEPKRLGNVHLWMKMSPSRQSIPEYRGCLLEAQAEAIALNADFARHDWVPVLLDFSSKRARAISALRRADVILVNSIADGMNLVVQEGVVLSQRHPAVILSRTAGAWERMADGVISIDALNEAGVVTGLSRALDLPGEYRRALHGLLLSIVSENSPGRWLSSQIDTLLSSTEEIDLEISARRIVTS